LPPACAPTTIPVVRSTYCEHAETSQRPVRDRAGQRASRGEAPQQLAIFVIVQVTIGSAYIDANDQNLVRWCRMPLGFENDVHVG
jgi:hypothetical protein